MTKCLEDILWTNKRQNDEGRQTAAFLLGGRDASVTESLASLGTYSLYVI